ncbi:outer membrane lipoprotein-sorting protein, partial [Myxococcota bacterium]|nr:outer membrane lipoprotein-sorting protein [Myxococcota bacterium]
KEDYVPRKAQYWDLSGELKKTFTVLEIKEVDTVKHRSRMMHMKMINEQNGRSSEMKTDKFQLRSDFPDDYFTTRYLERN